MIKRSNVNKHTVAGKRDAKTCRQLHRIYIFYDLTWNPDYADLHMPIILADSAAVVHSEKRVK